MARWVPRGLQRVVEAIQATLVDYSAGNISQEQLRAVLLQRRDQLHRAAEVTRAVEQSQAKLLEAMEKAQNQQETIAGTEALILQSSAA